MTRLILLIIFLLIALLAVCRAPAYYLWLLAIVVTEYPLIFAAIAVVLTGWGYWVSRYQLAGTIVGVVALLLYLSPIVRAYWVAKTLQPGLVAAFSGMYGDNSPTILPDRKPFEFGTLFNGTAELTCKTVTYAKYPGIKLKMDLYRAQNDELYLPHRPCVIVIHGGSWSSGDSKQLPELNYYLARRGFNVASINYRMAPKYQTPAPVEDVKQALEYLVKNNDELMIDTSKFILLGRSAGAQIALLAAYTLHDARIKGVVDFYGPADMVWGYSIPSNPLIMDSRGVMERYIGGTYQQVPDKYKACSPLEFVDDHAPPTLIIHGGNDVLVSPEHSRRLNLKLQQHNIRHYYLDLPWATHGFDFNLTGPGGQLSTFAVETFLNTVTQ